MKVEKKMKTPGKSFSIPRSIHLIIGSTSKICYTMLVGLFEDIWEPIGWISTTLNKRRGEWAKDKQINDDQDPDKGQIQNFKALVELFALPSTILLMLLQISNKIIPVNTQLDRLQFLQHPITP